jgi:hypothetical protein
VCLSIALLYGLRYSPALAYFRHRHSGQPHHHPRRTLRSTNRNRRPTNDEWLWDSTLLSFNRQYADVLGQEKARAELKRGFKMEKGDIDTYIAKFEQVIRQAGLDIDQPLVVNKFARGLPREMYDFIYTHKDPQMYEQWRNEAFKAQKRYVHLKN